MGGKIYLTIVLAMFCLWARAQQDPQYSFYKESALIYNPAKAGESGEMSAVFLNRNQWSGIEGAPVTMLLSADMPAFFLSEASGIGINMLRDELGFESTIVVNINYSHWLQTKYGKLSFGLSVGAFNKGINGEWYVPEGDGYNLSDPLLPDGEVSEIGFDVGFGAYFKGKNAFASFGITHLNQAEIEISDRAYTFYTRHYYLSAGYKLKTNNPGFEIEPMFMYKSDLAGSQLDLNADVNYKEKFSGGIGYRLNDGVLFRFRAKILNGLTIGYAFDLTSSALAAYSNGSHEIYVGYSFALQRSKAKAYKSVRYL